MTIDASKAPQKQKHNLVALAVRRAAPFTDADFDVAWASDGRASVWYWSRERVSALMAGQAAKRIEFVAEPLYVGAPESDATQLLALMSGVEGRIWKSRRIVASRWWSAAPSLSDWSLFLRSAGVASGDDTILPSLDETTLAAKPWSRSVSSTDGFSLAGMEHHLLKSALAVGMAFILLSTAQIGGILRAQADIWQARAASAGLDASLKRILAARESADAHLERIDALLSLRKGQSQTNLMAEAAGLMPQGPYHVRIWNQTAPDLIEVTIISPDANPEQMVAAWEASELFRDVTTELGRNDEVTIKANVVPDHPISGPEGI